MIVQRLLEPSLSFKDDELANHIDLSFSIFNKDILAQSQLNKVHKKFDTKIISNFVRFFRIINPNYKLDEDIIREIFKGKKTSLENLFEKIGLITQQLSTKINFCDKIKTIQLKNYFVHDTFNQSILGLMQIKTVVNFNWRIDLIISNTNSNRVLLPEIYLFFNFADGEQLKLKVGMKVFQEFRKTISSHIKKIIENERVNLLKLK